MSVSRRLAFVTAFVSCSVLLGGLSSAVTGVSAANPIRHVVFIYKENKTFDGVFAQFCRQHTRRCSPPPTQVTLADGVSVKLTAHGDLAPQLGHSMKMQQYGLANQWDHIAGCGPPTYYCLTYEATAGEPNTIALASKFAISDGMFSSNPMPSFGGHLETIAGGLDGFTGDNPQQSGPPGWGCDSGRLVSWTNSSGTTQRVYACVPDPSLPTATFPYGGAAGPTPVPYVRTILDECDAQAGCSWKFYAQAKDAADANGPYIWNTCTYVAECLYTSQATNDVAHDQILTDAQAGTLPSISYVMPAVDAGGNDDSGHNGESLAVEDTDIGRIVQAIENGPDWSTTAIFIAWDDTGGFYDHVTPPAGRGNRLPLLVVSPYARPQYTDHKGATQYSILAYIEHTLGLASLTALDSGAYDLSGAFNYSQRPLSPVHMVDSEIPEGEQPVRGLTPDDGGT